MKKKTKLKLNKEQSPELCPKCNEHMERRSRVQITKEDMKRPYIFTEWDYCLNCKHLQHYEKFKQTMNTSYQVPNGIKKPYWKDQWIKSRRTK